MWVPEDKGRNHTWTADPYYIHSLTSYPRDSITERISCENGASLQWRMGVGMRPPLVLMLKSSFRIRQSRSVISSRLFSVQWRSSHFTWLSFFSCFASRSLHQGKRRSDRLVATQTDLWLQKALFTWNNVTALTLLWTFVHLSSSSP